MALTYKHINKFSEIVDFAREAVCASEYELNFNIGVEFDVSLLEGAEFLDVEEDAYDFQKCPRPEHLYMNHGEYIKENGIAYIVSELNRKSNGNRALFSLISQDHIIDSGDKAIPSFMVFQSSLEKNALYATVYFRALEISHFFRINIEEIRIILKSIVNKITPSPECIRLNVIAFRAYIQPHINPLKRADMDMVKATAWYYILTKEPKKLISLLDSKKKFSTVIEYKCFEDILEIVSNTTYKIELDSCLTTPKFIKIIEQIIEKSKEIEERRNMESHSKDLEKLQKDLVSLIDKCTNEIKTIA